MIIEDSVAVAVAPYSYSFQISQTQSMMMKEGSKAIDLINQQQGGDRVGRWTEQRLFKGEIVRLLIGRLPLAQCGRVHLPHAEHSRHSAAAQIF